MTQLPIDLEDGDAIIVLKADGTLQFWHQSFPDLVADLTISVDRQTRTCDCEEDICPAWEMPGWNKLLLDSLDDIP